MKTKYSGYKVKADPKSGNIFQLIIFYSVKSNGFVNKPFDIYHLLTKVKEFIT